MYFAQRSAKANGLPFFFSKFYYYFNFGFIEGSTYSKVGKTYNKKETLTTNLDLCQLQSVTTNSVFVTFLPDIANQLATVFQPCPYSVGYV
jgi:hypothetical protein